MTIDFRNAKACYFLSLNISTGSQGGILYGFLIGLLDPSNDLRPTCNAQIESRDNVHVRSVFPTVKLALIDETSSTFRFFVSSVTVSKKILKIHLPVKTRGEASSETFRVGLVAMKLFVVLNDLPTFSIKPVRLPFQLDEVISLHLIFSSGFLRTAIMTRCSALTVASGFSMKIVCPVVTVDVDKTRGSIFMLRRSSALI
jgi:hypothetical protein